MEAVVYRHNRITRLTHWVNLLALLILLMSGLQIFNAYPNLHWGSKAEPDEAFFSIHASNDDGKVRGFARFYGWRFETTGFLGVQNTGMGPFPRAFPSWLTIPGYFWLAGGRRWHFFFAWLFVLNGILYFVYNLVKGHVSKFVLRPRDVAKVPAMALYYLRVRRESPQEGEYNPIQKLAYTGVFFILTPAIVLSGLAMSPQLDVAFHWLPAMFGGRQSARTFHFLCTLVFVLFTFGHVFMVLTTGLVNNMRSIITGWYQEKRFPPVEMPIREPVVEAAKSAQMPTEQADVEKPVQMDAIAAEKTAPEERDANEDPENEVAIKEEQPDEKR